MNVVNVIFCLMIGLPIFGVGMALYTHSAYWLVLLILCAAW